MSITLQDRLLVNYEKAIDEGRKVLIRACKLLLKGVPVANKLICLSHSEKKKLNFNEQQIRKVESGSKLEEMDTSLLHVIIRAFGGLSPGYLQDHLKELKDKRNNLAHEKQTLSLNKSELKAKLAELKTLYTSILNELKPHCNSSEISLLDHDISQMETQLVSLEKTLDDHILEKTHALVRATAKADAQIANSSATLYQSLKNTAVNFDACMTQSSSTLDQSLNQTVVNLNTHVNQSSATLDQSLNETATNLSAHMTQSSTTLGQSLSETAAHLNTNMNQSSATLEQNLNETAVNLNTQVTQSSVTLEKNLNETVANMSEHMTHAINQTTSVLENKINKVTTTLEEVTSKLHQMNLSNDMDFRKDSINDHNLSKTENREKNEPPTNSMEKEYKEPILQYLFRAQQPEHTNDIVRALGLKSKSEINSTLYELMKENSIQKVSESPPLWQVLNKELLSTQKEENLTSDDRRVLDILLKSSEPVKPLNLAKTIGLSKLEINNLLYSMQKKGLVGKVKEIPPLWQILESGRKTIHESTSNDN